MKTYYFVALLLLTNISLFATEYHISVKGNDQNDGSVQKPLKTIQAAANKAQPGDIITVHAGVYREWINPPRGGLSDAQRIVYQAAPGEKVEVKGSEQVTGWKKESNGIWKAVLSNSFFGDFNPFNVVVEGDWYGSKQLNHTGEVYLNGVSLYERDSISKVMNTEPVVSRRDPKGSTSVWYSEVSPETTTIWARFGDANPNKELVEVNARKTCFYPTKQGINYITIRGFHFSQAAAQWAAPTAEQIGLIATHWNKGWIIENNIISNAKCSGITLGKERETGHNVWSNNPIKGGATYYIEVTLRTLKNGWNKENIGSHIVRNNEIYHCEQTGMCGSMGAAFSEIYGNYIHDIWVKRQFWGAEIAGIKFHAAIDTWIHNNRIKNSAMGIWLDWMAQGARISNNLFYENDQQDIFMEVNHGPFIVDNNILLSPVSILEDSEGGAFVHNLFAGKIISLDELSRYTPYHVPHSTEIIGLSPILAGDERFYNNIFVGSGNAGQEGKENLFGLKAYDKARQKVWTGGNIYCNGAETYKDEKDYEKDATFNPSVQLTEKGAEVWLNFQLKGFGGNLPPTKIITSGLLGKTTVSDANFEHIDGTPLVFNKDYFGNVRSNLPFPGPFEKLEPSVKSLFVWKKTLINEN